MSTRKTTMLLMIAVIMLSIGCASKPQAKNANDIFNDDKNGSLTVFNQTSFDVVVFAGRVTRNNVLGGIKAMKSRTFDLNKLSLPAINGSFIIRGVSYENYMIKNTHLTDGDVLYQGLVVYDLNNPNVKINLEIYNGIDRTQKDRITVSNDSKFILDLRLNNLNGLILSTLSPYERNKQIFVTNQMDGMPFQIYPVYVYVDPNTNEITRFVTKSSLGAIRSNSSRDEMNVITFSGPKDNSDISYFESYLRVLNQTNEDFYFKDGMSKLKDLKGRMYIQSGENSTFMMDVSNSIGQVYSNLNIEFDSTKVLNIKNITVRPGVMYDLTIITQNGNPTYDIRETDTRRNNFDDKRINLLFE